MEEAWDSLTLRLEGLTDEEFFWEPIADCWTVHPAKNDHWEVDYQIPAPDPPPFTTIGWRLDHLAACKWMYHEYAFGSQTLTWDEIEVPYSATSAIHWLKEGHALLEGDIKDLKDADLDEMRLTNWGELWPTWRIFWAMITHDLHHGAEIGCLRDLYREMTVR
jgi:hypothetical protein